MDIKLALIISNERLTRDRVSRAAIRCGLAPICCETLDEARSLLAQGGFCVVLCDELLPDGDFQMAARVTRAFTTCAPVIVLAHEAEWDSYLQALAGGVFDYILCPPSVVESETIMRCALAEAARATTQIAA